MARQSSAAPRQRQYRIAAGVTWARIGAGCKRDGTLSELGDLIEAASLAPGKSGLLKAVIRAAEEAVEPEEAVRWLVGGQPASYEADARIAVGQRVKLVTY